MIFFLLLLQEVCNTVVGLLVYTKSVSQVCDCDEDVLRDGDNVVGGGRRLRHRLWPRRQRRIRIRQQHRQHLQNNHLTAGRLRESRNPSQIVQHVTSDR